ncbi:hypothetical protein [Neolewinella persica]|uniref:hypothetical protein n=1 Tax=Neolewinella persica TaxID=70998 RepID=UPI00037DACC8|nr:hypothetical protein [Neolewinella persica]
MSSPRSPFDRSPLGGIGGFIVGLIILYALFKLAGVFFSILWWAGPFIFIASLIVDHKVFLGYVGSLKRLFQRNWLLGLAFGVLSLVLYPLVSAYLLGMALFKKKLKEKATEADVRRNGEWADFEEVPEEPMDLDIDYEELPPAPEPQLRRDKGDTEYDELFE